MDYFEPDQTREDYRDELAHWVGMPLDILKVSDTEEQPWEEEIDWDKPGRDPEPEPDCGPWPINGPINLEAIVEESYQIALRHAHERSKRWPFTTT